MYSKAALYDDVLRWRKGGPAPSGAFKPTGAMTPSVGTGEVTYRQDKKKITGVNGLATPTVFPGNVFGLQWTDTSVIKDGIARFPTYFRDEGETRASIAVTDVPAETALVEQVFPGPNPTPEPYSAEPLKGSWATPGPKAGPFETVLADGSTVRYSWYRFIDQPCFQQFDWTQTQRNALQRMIVKMHRHWKIDDEYLPGRSGGELASFDPALFVTPPMGLELGYVPIVTWQGMK